MIPSARNLEFPVKVHLVVGGLALFALGLGLPSLVSRASAGDGAWQCYVVDRMPDMKAAAEWRGAINYATGLNEVAAGAPTGTIITTTYPAGGGMYAATRGGRSSASRSRGGRYSPIPPSSDSRSIPSGIPPGIPPGDAAGGGSLSAASTFSASTSRPACVTR